MLKTDDTRSKELRKANESVVMLMQEGKLKPFDRKLYLVLLREAQQQLLQMPDGGKNFLGTSLFRQKLSLLLKPITTNPKNMSVLARVALIKMQKTLVTFHLPDQSKEITLKSLQLLSEVKYEEANGDIHKKGGGDIYLRWTFPPSILAGLTTPLHGFTLISPEEISKLTSYASIALFEIATKFKNNFQAGTDYALTCKREKQWWVAALTGYVTKKDNTPRKLRDWRQFKYECVGPAIAEINELAKEDKIDISIELIELKEGGSTQDIQFRVRQKNKSPRIETTQAHTAAAEIGIPAQKITNLLAAGHSVEQLSFSAAKLKARQNDQTKEPIRNAANYLSAIVREETGLSEVLPAPVKKPKANPPSPEAKEALIVEEVTALSLLRSHILSIPDVIEVEYLNKVRAYLIEKGMLSPSTTRALDNKNWKTGIIFSKVVDIYAAENFGLSWKDLSAADMDYKIKGRAF